ncbi:hypothetical protein Tco_0744336 [Tanacetum coccineum]
MVNLGRPKALALGGPRFIRLKVALFCISTSAANVDDNHVIKQTPLLKWLLKRGKLTWLGPTCHEGTTHVVTRFGLGYSNLYDYF